MRIYDNGVYRDMTAAEEKAYHESNLAGDNDDKLTKIEKQVDKNTEDITATQEALCEIYEQII